MKFQSATRFLILLCISMLTATISLPHAYAAESFILTTQHGEQIQGSNVKTHYSINAGETIKDVLHIKRKLFNGQRPFINVNYFAVDAHMSQDGFISMSSELNKQLKVGDWTKLSITSGNIGSATEIPFTIHVPENATPGQYIGGLILVEEDQEGSDTKQELNNNSITKIRLRYATSISIDVKGEVNHRFEVNDIKYEFTPDGLKLSFKYMNQGNVVNSFTGYYLLDGIFTDKRIDIPQKNVLPGESLKFEYTYHDLIGLLGGFDATLHLDTSVDFDNDVIKNVFDNKQHINHLPTTLIIALFFIFLAVYGIIFRIIHGRIQIWEPYIIKKNENIFSIAEKSKINWKKLVRKNHIKPPYILKEKQKILVPTNDKVNIKQNKERKKK